MGDASNPSIDDEHEVVLEAAYEAGYFEHPRRTAGEEIAASLDLSPAAFQIRLQEATAACVERYLAERDEADD
ncbi:helix-turn-helix domain-containing protein [Haloterrigena sp. SYSU A121-1]|uniref:Helix-turn-helix domain-containing protein n=1 Tax=Haloterrigena gelatinilytica TaxID=2741724 RepID=A0A8J8GLD9_9EURY|nr:helix-turn-helix domain-containing protein [Haloterrigena gelatinilytica]NUB92183.1 helix-turn-helix domain-containing protein [Haloterrigena gelatinilytica]